MHTYTQSVCLTGVEEATTIGGHLAKLKYFSIKFLWRDLKFWRGLGCPGPPTSGNYVVYINNKHDHQVSITRSAGQAISQNTILISHSVEVSLNKLYYQKGNYI